MSRFHFDKNAITEASSKLDKICMDLSFEYIKFDPLILIVEQCDGFFVEQAAEVLRSAKQMLLGFIDSVKKGKTALNEITAKVEFYSEMVDSEELRHIVDYANAQDPNKLSNMFYDINAEASFIPKKYFTGWSAWGIAISQIKAALYATVQGSSYEKELLKRNIANVIATTSENLTLKKILTGGSEEYGDIVGDSEKLLDYDKKLDGIFKMMNEKYKGNPFMKYYGKFKENVKVGEMIFNDYAVNMEYLDSLERVIKDSGFDKEIVDSVMDELRWDYNNKYALALKDLAVDGLTKSTEEFLMKNPIGAAVITTLNIMEFMDMESNSKMDYAIIKSYENDTFFSYEKLEKTIKSGNYTEQDLMDYENMFNFIKTMETQKFNSALDFVKGENDKGICERAVDYYSNLTM